MGMIGFLVEGRVRIRVRVSVRVRVYVSFNISISCRSICRRSICHGTCLGYQNLFLFHLLLQDVSLGDGCTLYPSIPLLQGY